MTVRWMTPNSSSGAGVAGDAVLRQGMREEDGSGWEGDRLRLGHVETPGCRQDVGSGALGRGSGRASKPGMCKRSQSPRSGGACPGEQMEGEGARPGEQAHLRGG